MGNLPALLPNATPLVSKFFGKNVKETSVLKQRCDVNLKKKLFSISATFRDVSCNLSNNYPRISGKMSFTIEDKALIINN
jgi:hypothetical protein